MKNPEPCASVNRGRPPPSGKFGIQNSRKNRSNGGRPKNGGCCCSCSSSCEPISLEFVSCSLARTEITVGFTLWTIGAKLGGPDRSAGCAGPSAAAAGAKSRPGRAATMMLATAAIGAINAKRGRRHVRVDCSELATPKLATPMSILESPGPPCLRNTGEARRSGRMGP